MGWGEFTAWLRALKREMEAREVTPDSWANADSDPWWQQERAKRDAMMRGGR